MILRIQLFAISAFALLLITPGHAGNQPPDRPDILLVAPFSTATAGGDFPADWAPMTFKKIKRHTRYELVNDAGTVVVKAVSDRAASGIMRKMRIDLRQYPIIRWRWKVDAVYQGGDVTRKDGDDYPARIYITFLYDPAKAGFFDRATFEAAKLVYGEYPPMGAITYIWASKAPVSGVFANPYTDKVKMIVVRSGGKNTGRWFAESRNLLEDYRAAFGADPTLVSGIAIMTDSDNTGESATAYYGDIAFFAK